MYRRKIIGTEDIFLKMFWTKPLHIWDKEGILLIMWKSLFHH